MNIQFVDEWWLQFRKRVSIKVAALFALVMGLLTANPILVVGLINFLPEGLWKYVIALAVAVLVFAVPALISLIKQPKLQEKVAEKVAEKADV